MRELPPDAVTVTALPGYRLRIEFSNGEIRIFDVSPLLERKCYTALKKVELFNRARIEYGCVSWPGNIDIDPDWLYEDSVLIA